MKPCRVTPEMMDAGEAALSACLAADAALRDAACSVFRAMSAVPRPRGRPVSLDDATRQDIAAKLAGGASAASVVREFGIGKSMIVSLRRAPAGQKSEG